MAERQFPCIITRIIDGDTIECRVDLGFHVFTETRVRLNGIDAPETRTRDLEEKERGQRSKAFVEELLPLLSDQVLISYEIGKYGRCIGDFVVSHNGEMKLLSAFLVEGGYAEAKNYG